MPRQRLWRRGRSGVKRTVVFLLVVVAAASVVADVINSYVLRAGAGRIFDRVADIPARFTIIVPGAFVDGDVPSDVLEDRLVAAAEAFHSGLATRIFVSGDHGWPEYDEVRTMRLVLIREGVPSAAIFLDHAGFRTLDTMQRAAEVFGVGGAIVVTQRFHLARSLFLAQTFGIDAVGLVADKREYVYSSHYARREFLARVAAVLDVRLWGRSAKFLGAPIPIEGDARLTHDASTIDL